MGAGGVIVPPPTYFPRLREICDRHDVLLIADEVITGFGRTGRWFALGHWDVQPDIVSFAKGVTSGYLPLGGIILSTRACTRRWRTRRWTSATCTLPPIPAIRPAAPWGWRNVAIIEREGLVERSAVMGRKLLAGLETLRALPQVGDVRGLGMLAAVELVTDQASRAPAPGLGAKVVARGDGARADPAPARRRRGATGQRRYALPRAAADDAGADAGTDRADPGRVDRRRGGVRRSGSEVPGAECRGREPGRNPPAFFRSWVSLNAGLPAAWARNAENTNVTDLRPARTRQPP